MSSLGEQQKAMQKSADSTESLVFSLQELTRKMDNIHTDNASIQKVLTTSNIVMTVATIIMAVVAVISLYK